MARYTDDGLKVATSLFEAAAFHKAVKVTCRCCHSAVFHPHGLWWWFHRRGWNEQLRDIGAKFWCRHCRDRLRGTRTRPVKVELVDEAVQVVLPLPDDRMWNREVNRFRG